MDRLRLTNGTRPRPAALPMALAALAFACGGSTAAKRSSGTPPDWFHAPPKARERLYFVGDATGAPSEAEARDLAIQKAIAQLTSYCGATVKSDFQSNEREANGKHEYVVSMTVDVSGDEMTVREAVVKQTEVGKSGSGFDAYALVEWPETQYRQVLAAQRDRAMRALEKYTAAEAAEKRMDMPGANTELREAKAILGPMKSTVPLENTRFANSGLLFDAMKAMEKRLLETEQSRRKSVAVAVECVNERAETDCGSQRVGAVTEAVSRSGLEVASGALPGGLARDILGSKSPAIEASIRANAYVLAVRYESSLVGKDGPFTFVRCAARSAVFDTSTARIAVSHDAAPKKAGHPEIEGAIAKACGETEKDIVLWIESELRALGKAKK